MNKQLFAQGDNVILWVQRSNNPNGVCRFETIGKVNTRWCYVAGKRFNQRNGMQIGSSIYMIERVTPESVKAAHKAKPLTL